MAVSRDLSEKNIYVFPLDICRRAVILSVVMNNGLFVEIDKMRQSETLKNLLATLEPYEGKALGRMSEETLRKLQETIETANLHGAQVLSGHCQTVNKTGTGHEVNLSGLREYIGMVAGREHALETLKNLDSYKTWQSVMEAQKAAWSALQEDASRAGLKYSDWTRVIDLVSIIPAAHVIL